MGMAALDGVFQGSSPAIPAAARVSTCHWHARMRLIAQTDPKNELCLAVTSALDSTRRRTMAAKPLLAAHVSAVKPFLRATG